MVSLPPTLILPSYCIKAQWVTSCLICSTINGTELPSDFSHFWQIWGRTSSWIIKTFQLIAFLVGEKKKKKPEEFGTRQLFFTIYFYFFISYQLHSLEDVWGQDQQLVVLAHELCNWSFIILWGSLEGSLATSNLSHTVVFHCKLMFLIADAFLSQYCKKRQLTQCFAKGTSSFICGKELSLLQNISSHTALWVQLTRQLPRSNFVVPSLILRKPNPGSKHSGSAATKSPVMLEKLLFSEQLLLQNKDST